jgi:oxygen-independent coproporphyrinogen III oxidase
VRAGEQSAASQGDLSHLRQTDANAVKEEDFAGDALGIYLSVPFCRSKCTYCNFASGVYPAAQHERYVKRVIEDLAGVAEWATRMGVELPRRVDSVYLGGGTPSLLAPELIARLFAAIRSEFDLDPGAEITVECAPGQLPDETLRAMLAAGVNRVSLGVQSFVDREAALSGRLHNRAIVIDDIRRLRRAGISNLNVDLIAGLAGQTLASWSDSLTALIALGVPHASVYMLEVDEDSRLGHELLAHGARYSAGIVPADDAIAQMYSVAIERLAPSGLEQYEISNFAQPGFASRHNLRYWQQRPYLGLGLDASSALAWRAGDRSALAQRPADVLRFTTTSDLKIYLEGPSDLELDWISPERQLEEAWFLGLRLNRGVDLDRIEQEFGAQAPARALPIVDRLADSGLLSFDGETVCLTPMGRLLSNEVFQEFIGLGAGCEAVHA